MESADIDRRITATEWASTPESVKAVIVELAEKIEYLNAQYELLSSQMLPLAEQMGELESKLTSRKAKGTRKRGFGRNIRVLSR